LVPATFLLFAVLCVITFFRVKANFWVKAKVPETKYSKGPTQPARVKPVRRASDLVRQHDQRVELRGQLSNPSAEPKFDLVYGILCTSAPGSGAWLTALRPARQVRIRDRVDVDELVSRFVGGEMIKELALDYAISESSVKRLLRSRRRSEG
jgi:hypothetical protein